MNRAGRVPKRYFYRDQQLTILDLLAEDKNDFSRGKIQIWLKAGRTVEEILHPELYSKRTKMQFAKAARDQKKLDPVIIKQGKKEEERRRALEIMSVPINPEKTTEHYIMKRFTHRASSNLGEAAQRKKNGQYEVE